MQSFSDFLPEDAKRLIAERNFKVGAVLKFQVNDTNPPKLKRLIIVGFDDEKVSFACVFINSKINPHLFRTKILQDLHLEFEASGRAYLDHTSFVDCSQIFEKDISSVKQAVANDLGILIGELTPVDLENVRKTISGAHTITPRVKKKYGLMGR